MKYTLISTAFLISIGVSQAGDLQQEKTAMERAPQTLESTAVRPGIGDRGTQFENPVYPDFATSQDDWTDLRSQEIYGSF